MYLKMLALFSFLFIPAVCLNAGTNTTYWAISFSAGPEFDNNSLAGFNTYHSLEWKFHGNFSANFNSRFYYRKHMLDSGAFIDHYENTQVYLALELKYYPFDRPFLKEFFLGAEPGLNLCTYLYPDSFSETFSIGSVIARAGYKFILFGESGLFIQPSVAYSFVLAPASIKPRYLENYKPVGIFYYLIELGWIF